jgi:hypothetical protein
VVEKHDSTVGKHDSGVGKHDSASGALPLQWSSHRAMEEEGHWGLQSWCGLSTPATPFGQPRCRTAPRRRVVRDEPSVP